MGNFGNSEAGKTLDVILKQRNDRKLNRKVSRLYGGYMASLSGIDTAKGISLTNKLKLYYYKLIYNDTKKKIKVLFDEEIADFLTNVITIEIRIRNNSYNQFRLIQIKEIAKQAIITSKQQLLINQEKKNENF